jgi:hypothetical protein
VAKLDLKTTSMIQLVLQVNGRARSDDLQGLSADAANEALRAYHALHSTTEPMYFEGDSLVIGPATPGAVTPFAAPASAPVEFGAPVTDFGAPAGTAPVFNVPEVTPAAPAVQDFTAAPVTPGVVDFGMPAPSAPPVTDFGVTPAPVPSAFETPAPAPAPAFDFSEIPPAAPVPQFSEEPKRSSSRLLLLLVLLVAVVLAAVVALGWSGLIDLPFGLFSSDQGAPVRPATVPTSTLPGAKGATASVPATK